jgi:hypothetical protein
MSRSAAASIRPQSQAGPAARDLKTAAQPVDSTRPYEPALSTYLPLIAIIRYGAAGHGDRAARSADILRQAHEGPEQSVISSAARWMGRRSVIPVR